MKLIEIIDSVKLIDGKAIFVQSSYENENKLLTEYLTNYDRKRIRDEIEKLEEFDSYQQSNDKVSLENYLTYELDAIIDYDFGTFAYIAGANDLTITVLYDLKENKVFLKHPYGEKDEKFFIEAKELIGLLKKIELILYCFID